MGAEAAGSILLFSRSLGDHIGSYGTAAGGLGLAGQIAFGLFPVIQYLCNNTVPARRWPAERKATAFAVSVSSCHAGVANMADA